MTLAHTHEPLLGKLKVLVMVYPPDNRRRDLDNIFKALLDAIEHAGVYVNDNQICDLQAVRCDVIKGGQVVVHIEEIKKHG